MEAVLKFKLPADEVDFEFAIRGNNYWEVLREFGEWLINQLKHNTNSMSEDEISALEKCREKFFELIEDYDINLCL